MATNKILRHGDVRNKTYYATGSITLNVSANARFVMTVVTTSVNACGSYIVYSSTQSVVGYKTVAEATSLTITTGTGTLSISITSGSFNVMLQNVVDADIDNFVTLAS